jgi:hypothetical protein
VPRDLPPLLNNIGKLKILSIQACFIRVFDNCLQRAGLYAGWELEFRLPITAAD